MPCSEKVWKRILFLKPADSNPEPRGLERLWKDYPQAIVLSQYKKTSSSSHHYVSQCSLTSSSSAQLFWLIDSWDRDLVCPSSYRWKKEWFHDMYLHLQGRAGEKVVPLQSGKEVFYSPICLYADDQDKSILFNFLDKEIYYKPWPEISYFCLLFSTIFPFCFTLALLLLFTSLNTRHHAITQNVLQMFIHTWSGGVFQS